MNEKHIGIGKVVSPRIPEQDKSLESIIQDMIREYHRAGRNFDLEGYICTDSKGILRAPKETYWK